MTSDLSRLEEERRSARTLPIRRADPRRSRMCGSTTAAYDLTDWIAKHPGGAFFIGRTKNRDITSIVKSYHPNPEAIERILERYCVGPRRDAGRHPPEEQRTAIPVQRRLQQLAGHPEVSGSTTDNDLLHRVKARLREPALAARIKRMDTLFNIVVALLAVAYVAVQGLRLGSTRLDAAADLRGRDGAAAQFAWPAFGHYAIHRAQKGLTRVLDSSLRHELRRAWRWSSPTDTPCCTTRTRRAKSTSRRTCSR